MKIGKILMILASVLLLTAAAFADTSDWNSLSSAAGDSESAHYKTRTDMIGSGVVQGNASAINNTFIGFLAGFVQLEGDGVAPVIADFMINGKRVGTEVKDGDYIDRDASVTAKVTDNSGINQSSSQVGADSDTVAFNSPSATYNAATGALAYNFGGSPLADGDYTVKILAVDTTGGTTTSAVSVKVESELKTVNALTYPNPYNPDKGNLQIGYMLTRSSDQPIDIWILNSFNQPVKRITIPAGSAGTLAGYNVVSWNGVDNFGNKVSPQLLIFKISAGKDILATVKVAVLR